jgi:hypothetical protein
VNSAQEGNPNVREEQAMGSLRFERRQHDRWPITGVATAYRAGGDRFGETATLKLLDYSAGGLGALCDEPIEPGSVISVGFHEPGCPPEYGVVVRCLPCGDGYRIAVCFERRMAA